MNTTKKFIKIVRRSNYLKDFTLVSDELLLDFILDVKSKSYRVKSKPLNFLYDFTYEDIYSLNRLQLEVIFEKIRTCCHSSADLLKYYLPNLNIEILNKLSFGVGF